MRLTINQFYTIKWMQKYKQQSVNVTDRHKYLPLMTAKQFQCTMKQLENKGLIAKESSRQGEYVYFVGWYLTDSGRNLNPV